MAFETWVTFIDGAAGCILQPPNYEGRMTNDAAGTLASEITGKAVTSVNGLPYAARPVLNRADDWPPGWGMTLCYTPKECQGHSSCPKRHACSE